MHKFLSVFFQCLNDDVYVAIHNKLVWILEKSNSFSFLDRMYKEWIYVNYFVPYTGEINAVSQG